MSKEFRARCRKNFTKEQAQLLDDALSFAERMHKGQTREDGDPFISHPVAVADIVMELGLGYTAVAAALLHDSVEDTTATEEDVRNNFGAEIADLVAGVTKFKNLTFSSKEDEQAKNFLKMFFAMAKDIRVLIIKLADRLHNMRTLDAKRPASQKAKAQETLDIYAPLASRLGLSYLRGELEDLSFKTLYPQEYEELARTVALKREERKSLLDIICTRLEELLENYGIKGEVNGRPKHFYSIYKKMTAQKRAFEQIYDLTAVRVLVNTSEECYAMMGAVHTEWKPIPGRFKDFISTPRPNNYRSLHTAVMTNHGFPCEIQIRTFEMHKVAEYGIAAHWKYKDKREKSDSLDKELMWLRGFMDQQSENAATPQEFYESVKFNFSSGEVFTFTPKGKVIILPEGATPIDFAYRIHSEVGNKCAGAKVNGRVVPLESKLQTGDLVEIFTSANRKGPSRDWLRFAKTTEAVTKIKAFFKKEMKDENIRLGKLMLEEEAKHRGYKLSQLMAPKWLNIIMQRYTISSVDDLYASVGYGGFTVNQILLKLIDFYKKEVESKSAGTLTAGGKQSYMQQGIIISGYDDLLVRFALCCNPVPGDDITGFISRGRGVAVHRKNCPNVKNVEKFRLIEAEWAQSAFGAPFTVNLQIEAGDRSGLLADVTTAISALKLSISSLNCRIDKNQTAIISAGVRIHDIGQADNLISKIASLDDVKKVFRM
ncbi:MAG: bifunctional (p)ppGpp synthetase/guanosine-3',5'-bis(diphosphate) 3'-pyrophosphohydrolase [Firmicutes bacterium]|nr:bifunctional (p)ppGpp synthetase/guanosine-3',5'-bis(diphosphate) 3'-pyrophosphohydrolase [Bacillota bacterium]